MTSTEAENVSDNKDVAKVAATFELHDPAIQEDPYPTYALLRERCPVAWSEQNGGHWTVTRYELASEVFQDPETYSNEQALIPNWEFPLGRQIPVEIDGEPHRLYRLALSTLFNPRMVKGVEPRMRETARRLATQIVSVGSGDLVADFAVPLTSETFLHTFDLPVDVLPDMLTFKDLLVHGGSAGRQDLKAGEQEIVDFFHSVIEQRRKDGATGDDVMSHLLRAKYGDRPLTDDEIVNTSVVLMLASLDTTTATLSNAFGYLAEHPDRRRKLVDDPGLVPNAVEEFLRYEGITGTTRTAVRDTELGGVQISAGDKVMLVIGATGRDADVYESPDKVNFAREGIRHLTFGIGPHRCLGMHLARQTMVVGIQEFHAAAPEYGVTPGQQPERVVGHVRSVRKLPVTVHSSTEAR
jgi:cytochrome P450